VHHEGELLDALRQLPKPPKPEKLAAAEANRDAAYQKLEQAKIAWLTERPRMLPDCRRLNRSFESLQGSRRRMACRLAGEPRAGATVSLR
jgi:hypothetical protein